MLGQERPQHRTLRFVTLTACLILAVSGAFANRPASLPLFSTWNADMIDIERVSETGRGVYIAVLDTGLAPNWRDYFPAERISTRLGTGFYQPVTFSGQPGDPCGIQTTVGQLQQTTWIGSAGDDSGFGMHGTHIASAIIGFHYHSNFDTIALSVPLPPVTVRGLAPDATIIPVKVLANYQLPARPGCAEPGPMPAASVISGTPDMLEAGIRYVIALKTAGYAPMVINLSLGSAADLPGVQAAIEEAIARGVIVVAAAGNAGDAGMTFPGRHRPVISVGAVGWTREWLRPTDGKPPYRLWWLETISGTPMLPGSGDVADPTLKEDIYVLEFSGRALEGQQLDVLAPGSWIRGPASDFPGFAHLPWFSRGLADLAAGPPNFLFVGGTSFATPHVTAVAALMLEKNPALIQSQVENNMKATVPRPSTLRIDNTGSKDIFDFVAGQVVGPRTVTWSTDCGEFGVCDPVGAGLIVADKALKNTF